METPMGPGGAPRDERAGTTPLVLDTVRLPSRRRPPRPRLPLRAVVLAAAIVVAVVLIAVAVGSDGFRALTDPARRGAGAPPGRHRGRGARDSVSGPRSGRAQRPVRRADPDAGPGPPVAHRRTGGGADGRAELRLRFRCHGGHARAG
ncbi:hypothetical protein ACODT5_01915 [Streptomyces sp. 5.8]|uniref:hypothetical protein n=1 Tax=Streptomyces sp. 5.8 TaxID=3406571 RepID=UPI003BB7595F